MWTVSTNRGFRNYAPKPETLAKRRDKARKVLEAAGLGEAFAIFEATPDVGYTAYEERTISDIVGRLARWGTASDKALGYVRALLAKIPERETRKAERAVARAAEHEAAAPVPVTDGRVVVEGEVVTVKDKETRYGPVLKMLVRTDAGYKLWGTVPRILDQFNRPLERGDRVRFEAKIERSDRDEKFGFFSRPTKAVVLTAAKVAEEAA